MSDLSDSLTQSLRAAPELYASPSTAMAVSQYSNLGLDTAQNAQAAAHAANLASLQQQHLAQQKKTPHGFWSGALRAVYDVGHAVNKATAGVAGDIVGFGAHIANAGLQEVQHQYRYLHDVEARHGVLAALGAGLGDVVGGTIGGIIGTLGDVGLGPEGTILGAEFGGGLVARNVYADSWNRTTKGATYRPNYNRATGQYSGKPGTVSFGRDLSSSIGLGRSGILSGIADATFDLELDPFKSIGGAFHDVNVANYTPKVGDAIPRLGEEGDAGIQAFAAGPAEFSVGSEGAASTVPTSTTIRAAIVPPNVDDFLTRIAPKAGFQSMAKDVAGMDAQQLLTYKGGAFADIATELGEAKTPEDVTKVIANAVAENSLRSPHGMVPHNSIVRRGAEKLGDVVSATGVAQTPVGQAVGKATYPLRTYTREAIDYTNPLRPKRAGQNILPVTADANIATYEDELRATVPAYQDIVVTHDLATGQPLASKDVYTISGRELAHNAAKEILSIQGDSAARQYLIKNQLLSIVQDVKFSQQAGDIAKMSEAEIAQKYPSLKDLAPQLGEATTAKDVTDVLAKAPAELGVGIDNVFSPAQAQKIVNEATKSTIDTLKEGSAYGFDYQAGPLSQISEGDSSPYAAIWLNQQGHMIMPDHIALRRALVEGGKWVQSYRGVDDWMAAHITRPFKQLALLSGATALRIALSEAIPEFMRSPVGYVNSLITNSIAKDSLKGLTDEEATDAMHQFLRVNGLYDAEKSGNLGTLVQMHAVGRPEDAYVAARLAQENSGRISNAVVNSRDILTEDAGARAEKSVNLIQQLLPTRELKYANWGGISNIDDNHVDAWFKQLLGLYNEHSAQVGAQSFLDSWNGAAIHDEAWMNKAMGDATLAMSDDLKNVDPKVLSGMRRMIGIKDNGQLGLDLNKTEDLAKVQAEALRGLTFAPAETGNNPHLDLLDRIANKRPISRKALTDIDERLRPSIVPGRELLNMGNGGLLERVANYGWKHVFDPIISVVSRDPQFTRRMAEEWSYLRPMVENGTLAEDSAWAIAQDRATNAMMPFIHNPTERSMFADMARNFMPFYYAQEQAYKRLIRLGIDDPGAFRGLQLAGTAITNAGQITTDANSQKHMVYPGLGFLAEGTDKMLGGLGIPMAGAVPMAIGGQLGSLESVIPGSNGVAPEFGPLVSVPLHALENFMPESQPIIHGVLGDAQASGSIWNQLLPNSVLRNVVTAMGQEHSRSFQSSMMQVIQVLKYNDDQNPKVAVWNAKYQAFLRGTGPDPGIDKYPGVVPPPNAGPVAQQQFIDRVKNQTRINFLFKAIMGSVLPAAPTLDMGNVGLKTEYQNLIAKEGISKASVDFIKSHPDATAYTVFQSKTTAGGYIPAVQEAQNWIDKNRSIIEKYPYSAAWLIPQPKASDPFSAAAYNEQMAQRMRMQKTPDQFYQDLYTAAGNHQFYDVDKKEYDKQLAALQAAGDKTGIAALRSQFSDYLLNFGKQNPIWWNNFNSEDRKHNRALAIDGLNEMVKRGVMPKGQQTEDIRGLLGDYEEYQLQLVTANAQYGKGSQQKVKDDWDKYMDFLKTQKPNLAPAIDQIFRAGA